MHGDANVTEGHALYFADTAELKCVPSHSGQRCRSSSTMSTLAASCRNSYAVWLYPSQVAGMVAGE